MGKKGKIATSASGVGLAILGVGVPLTLPQPIPEWLPWTLIAVGLALCVLPWILSWLQGGGNGEGGVVQTSHGRYSPNFSGPVRDVHIHPVPTSEDIGLWPAIESGMRHRATKALEERNRLDSLTPKRDATLLEAVAYLQLAIGMQSLTLMPTHFWPHSVG